MLWIKSLHIIFMVTWFSGLFYLPRLFVYHGLSEDRASRERFATMERKLFFVIMNPSAVLTVIFGLWLWLGYGFSGLWLQLKLALVLVLIGLHIYYGVLMRDLRRERNKHSHVFYRWLNELPLLFLVAIVLLVVIKPFS